MKKEVRDLATNLLARIPPGVANIDFNILHFVIAYGVVTQSETLSKFVKCSESIFFKIGLLLKLATRP